jgi:hypothetical protein
LSVKLLLRAITAVRCTPFDELLRMLEVERDPFRLPVGPMGPADLRPLLPMQAQPPKVSKYDLLVRLGAPLPVGVLDA